MTRRTKTISVCLGMASIEPKPSLRRLVDLAPVLRNRRAMGSIFGYGAHCFELYVLRTWIVSFRTDVAARNGGWALLEPLTVSARWQCIRLSASDNRRWVHRSLMSRSIPARGW
jgi:hypothetical protein